MIKKLYDVAIDKDEVVSITAFNPFTGKLGPMHTVMLETGECTICGTKTTVRNVD